MRLYALVLVLAEVVCLNARSLPIRRFDANIIPLAITEDREGLLWLASPRGVWRFDGMHFEAVQAPAGIDLTGARQIAAAPDGSMWIGTTNGLVRYRDGKFTKELPGPIEALTVTRGGRILTTSGNRTELDICLEPEKGPCRWARLSTVWVTGQFHEDLDGNTWFGAGTFMCAWSDADVKVAASTAPFSRLRRIPLTGDQPFDLSDVIGTPDRRVWGRNGPDVLRIEQGGPTGRTALPLETYDGVRPGFLLDRRGRLWIPGRRLHVVENGALQPLPASPPLENVTAVFEDRRNTLWFGQAGKGLVALPDEDALESWSEAEGIPGSVLDLAVHPRLGLVAATDSGALTLAEGAHRWQAVEAAGGRMALRSVAADAAGALLYLPYQGDLLLSPPPFRATRELPLPPGMETKRLRKLYRDSRGTLWIADSDGLFRMDPAGHVRQVRLPEKGIHASDFGEDAEGRLWVGYEGGVARCVGADCTAMILPRDGLISPKIRTIAPGPDEIWVGYRDGDGFSRFQQQQSRWVATQFRPESGYGPIDTHFLRRDRRGWIWRGSTDGVYVSDGKHTEPEDWIHLTFGERINASYAHMYGFLEAADGSVWIGTQAGVVHLHPGVDWFTAGPPRLEQVVVPGRGGDELVVHLSQPGLPPFQSHLFRYRLMPVDTGWRRSADGTVRYPKLPGGAYRFEVAAGHGRPSLEYAFRVETPFGIWTPLGIGLALVTVAGLALVLARWRRSMQKTSEGARYWEEKRQFLEARGDDKAADPPAEDWSGRCLAGRFLLQHRLAGGGFASVYRALDQAMGGEIVAVKLLHPLRDHEEWRRRRFVEEVAALQKVHHSGVIGIRAAGEATLDRPYLVMDFIDGVTLRDLLAGGPLEFDRSARLLTQIGEALAAAHRAGILHRDLKPENVMVTGGGSAAEQIKLIDFGVASSQVQDTRTHTTRLAGSPGYLAPERWVGLATCSSDIYSLAAIAAELVTGTPVADLQFSEDDSRSLGERMQAVRPSAPQGAIDLLVAALSYDPGDRPQDAEVFAHNLAGCLNATQWDARMRAPL